MELWNMFAMEKLQMLNTLLLFNNSEKTFIV